MSVRRAGRRAGRAIRQAVADGQRRAARGRLRAVVLGTRPLRLDVLGVDLELDETDVTIGRTVETAGFDAGDVLVLLDGGDDAFVAVDVET